MTRNTDKKPKAQDLLELGKFYYLNGKLPQARKEFERAAEINSKNADVHYNLGLVYESQNDRVNAQDSYERALEIDPKHSLSRKHLNKLIGLKD